MLLDAGAVNAVPASGADWVGFNTRLDDGFGRHVDFMGATSTLDLVWWRSEPGLALHPENRTTTP